MDKGIVKSFAVRARTMLREHVTDRAHQVGVTPKGAREPLGSSTKDLQLFDIGGLEATRIEGVQIDQRRHLVNELNRRAEDDGTDISTAFESIVEETAYTWFNRMIAIRFMEINGYLHNSQGISHNVRVLSSATEGRVDPDILRFPLDAGFAFTAEEKAVIVKYQHENALNPLFHLLFLKQCNELSESLGFLFERTDGNDNYMELLFDVPYTGESIIRELVEKIPEEYFDVNQGGQIEIIGWMYQYYNSEWKDEVYARPTSKKIEKQNIPAVTQLFTPQWIVRYLVENSLGRLWEESHENSKLSNTWDYYLPEAEQTPEVEKSLQAQRQAYANIDPREIKLIDPSMGSGHILVYAFDILMEMYKSMGYRERDAVHHIINHNLYGLDIDRRATQLAYFAVMMKAREYDRSAFGRGLVPHLYSIEESNLINQNHLPFFGNDDFNNRGELQNQLSYLVEIFHDGKEYGSVLKIEQELDYSSLTDYISVVDTESQVTFDSHGIEETQKELLRLLKLAEILDDKYHIVVTNPPYMGSRGMNPKLTKYLKDHYPHTRSDLFAVFMEQCLYMARQDGYMAMITQHAWMFLKSYEKLRESIVRKDVLGMAHLGARAFDDIGGEVVQTTAFVIVNSFHQGRKGKYARLVDTNGELEKRNLYLEAITTPSSKYLYTTTTENFTKIPGMPIAYWASEAVLDAFEKGTSIGEIAHAKQGLATANNARFLRQWHEVEIDNIKFNATSVDNLEGVIEKWFPYNKGGSFRKWYGNYDYVVNWENDGYEIKNFTDNNGKVRSRPQNTSYYFKASITWSDITSGDFAVRYRKQGSIYDVSGMSAFISAEKKMRMLLLLLNSKISNYVFRFINPTIHLQIGNFVLFPVLEEVFLQHQYIDYCQENISISKTDWDSFETSWDFEKHPMIIDTTSIATAYETWRDFTAEQFHQLHNNEEELNRIFIDIYGLQDDLTPDVDLKDVTITKIVDTKEEKIPGNAYSMDKQGGVESFVSYAVGCILGRYSLDVEGLAFAGGEWDKSRYTTYQPVVDNVVLVTQLDSGIKDIVSHFVDFVEIVYGTQSLEENLAFIAEALGKKGVSSREKIRGYFYDDFYKDHVRRYQKTPIYWQLESGLEKKKSQQMGGFKALTYMHRYDRNTIGKARLDYLHPLQSAYELQIGINQSIATTTDSGQERVRREEENELLEKKLTECKEYDPKLGHLASVGTEIDLDDGVAVNHEKVQLDRENVNLKILTSHE